MAGLDLATCEAQLAIYLAAEIAVLAGQRVVIDGSELFRANLDFIQAGIRLWDGRCKLYSRTGIKVREVIPR